MRLEVQAKNIHLDPILFVSSEASAKSGQNNVGLCGRRGIEIFARSASHERKCGERFQPVVLPVCAVWPSAKEASLLTSLLVTLWLQSNKPPRA